ncbi:uncharacterized protein PGTG_02346 [Puccinia graminis f. sp. tritici CRL 75-36-700-3]|uniref:Uncharacterized protein n=1 Tax=Puccinia graminis f. sp. tritici (strain CRL 75-36-700-3 / race SCCL) TaxID=418459 RepID=E3JXW0_PUCGT|nr:uncharacterized protein PGTG_02346 [Puccinia graminis f. sp. tritici CRL 75-36-700-3]EFP76885.1 hypothetical protein PGTG_02346 [Puccinia graminis f. sp. tritici CRL 75-36-700-3]
MVDQHRLSSGGLPNAPNHEPSNLWIRRTPNGPHVPPINQAKRGASPTSNDCKPNVRPKNVAPDPAQAARSQLTTTVDEEELNEPGQSGGPGSHTDTPTQQDPTSPTSHTNGPAASPCAYRRRA